MNTIEPDYISEHRLVSQEERDNLMELQKTDWFLSVLERDSISNEEEVKKRIWEELEIFGYTYIGKIKIHKRLFKFLYKLKLVNI